MWIDQEQEVIDTHFAMGTVMTHCLLGAQAEDCRDAIKKEIGFLERKLSRFILDSDISLLNQYAGIKPVRICPETLEVLYWAKNFSSICPDGFDVTIAPLVSLWNIGKSSFRIPDEDEICQKLNLVNGQDLVLDHFHLTAALNRLGQCIDLGAVGKGYTANCLTEMFQRYQLDGAYSNLGGNVIAYGRKPDGSPWRIGIQHPRKADELLGVVSIQDESVVSSGDYQRFSEDSHGNYYHHILDPRTGYPCRSEFTSVTILSQDAMAADALSTAVFVLGKDRGLELIKKLSKTEAILVDFDGKIAVTGGLKHRFLPAGNVSIDLI